MRAGLAHDVAGHHQMVLGGETVRYASDGKSATHIVILSILPPMLTIVVEGRAPTRIFQCEGALAASHRDSRPTLLANSSPETTAII